jgi:hypothetical protein
MKPFLSPVVGITLVAIGLGALLAPRLSSRPLGLPVDDRNGRALVRALGARDLILGGIVLASLDEPAMLRRVFGWSAVLGFLDAAVVVSTRGPQPALILHLGGAAAVWVISLET